MFPENLLLQALRGALGVYRIRTLPRVRDEDVVEEGALRYHAHLKFLPGAAAVSCRASPGRIFRT